jgi:hypothetical protein
MFEGVHSGVLIAESLWPNSAHADGCGINMLTGADPTAPIAVGASAFQLFVDAETTSAGHE